MPELLHPLDSSKVFTQQKHTGSKCWHPDNPPNVTVRPDTTFRVHCWEWFGGAINDNDSAEDLRDAPLNNVHVLSRPTRIDPGMGVPRASC